MARWFGAVLIAAFSLLSARSSAAAQHYVSTHGNDSNPGSLARPWKTLYKACHTAAAGDTVYVRGGTYDGVAVPGVGVLNDCGGSSGSPISFVGYAGSVNFTNYVTLGSWEATGTTGVYSTEIDPHTVLTTSPITWAYVNEEWVALTGPAYFDAVPQAPGQPTGLSDLQPGQTLLVGTTFYLRLPNGRNPGSATVRLPQAYGIHLYGAHDVVLDGINVSFATKGYQVEPDGAADAAGNVMRNADVGYVSDGVSAAAADTSVIGMNIHHVGLTKYEHGIYASKEHLLARANTFSDITGAPVHCNPRCDYARIEANDMHMPRPYTTENAQGILERIYYYPAVTLLDSVHVTALNNVVWGDFEFGFLASLPGEYNSFYNNTIVLTSPHGKGFSFYDAHRGLRLINNIVVAEALFFEEYCSSCGAIAPVIDANTYHGKAFWMWQATAKNTPAAWQRASGAVADEHRDPGFVDSGSGDFGLTAASWCVDSGVRLMFVSEDFTGSSRPQGAAYDRGAFERDQSSSHLRASPRRR